MTYQNYHVLMTAFFNRLGLEANPDEDGVYVLEVDDRFQVLFSCYQHCWLQLFCEMGPNLPPYNNLFGAQWPAHIQAELDGQSILWSQHPLAGLDCNMLQNWVSSFIDTIEQRLKRPIPKLPSRRLMMML